MAISMLLAGCGPRVADDYSRLPDETNAAGGAAQVTNSQMESSHSSSQSSEDSGLNQSSSANDASSSAPSSSDAEASSSSSGSGGSSSEGESGVDLPGGDWRLILVNSTHPLDKEYEVELTTVAGGFYFDARAADELNQMFADASAAGIDLQVISTYRSFARSEQNYNRKKQELISTGMTEEDAAVEAAKWIAPPGQSEHNTGLAIDVVSPGYWNQYADLLPEFEEDPAFEWLYANCANYGFILRFPKDKEEITKIVYEPWHYRYVGVEHAKKIMEQKICLEEYVEQLG